MKKIYDLKIEGSAAIITMLNGEIYLEQIEEIRKSVLKLIEEGKDIIFNLSKVIFISSAFLIILVSCLKRAKENDREVVISNLSPEAARVLRITGMDKVIPVYDTEKDALKALSREVK